MKGGNEQDRQQQPHPQPQEQLPYIPLARNQSDSMPQPTTTDHEAPPYNSVPVPTDASSTNASKFNVLQSPSFASASLASMASLEDAHASKNVYAIQTSVVPVARAASSGANQQIDDSDLFECLHQLFANEAYNSPSSSLTAQPSSNMQLLMDPLAWLPNTEPAPSSTNVAVMSPPPPPMAEAPVSSFHMAECVVSHTSTSNIGNCSEKPASNPKALPVKAAAGKVIKSTPATKTRRPTKSDSSQINPFDFLKSMLTERGYTFATIKSSEVGYMTDPSPLQLASFGTTLIKAVHSSDIALLSSLLGCGLSPNPCNQFRDHTLGWVCRKAQDSVFRCFLEHHAEIKFCDAFGRTPLHHAAWADIFSPLIVTEILKRDKIQFFLEDNNGQTPLEYVPSKLTTQWIAYLDIHKDELFPKKGPPLAVTKRDQFHLPDPPNAVSVDLARLLSSGQLQPEQLAQLDGLSRRTWTLPK